MEIVSALRTREDVNAMMDGMDAVSPKYGVMFRIGVDTGLRVSDVLGLRVACLKGKSFRVCEQKTKKCRVIRFSDELRAYLKDYVKRHDLNPLDFLVYRREWDKGHSVSRIHAYRVIKRVAGLVGLNSVGTHSMRKTFALNHFRANHDLDGLRAELNHKYLTTTLGYLLSASEIKELNI